MSELRGWLKGLGLEEHADAIETNEVDLDLVRDLNDVSLKELGARAVGHRVPLLRALERKATAEEAALQSNSAGPPPRTVNFWETVISPGGRC